MPRIELKQTQGNPVPRKKSAKSESVSEQVRALGATLRVVR